MASEIDRLSLEVELLNALKEIKGGTLATASENDRLSPGVQLLNFLKLAGDVAIIPGTSLLMQGKVPQGGTHALLGWLAKTALGSVTGTVGWLLLAANSYAKSTSGTYLHDYVVDLFVPRSEPDDAITAPPAAEEPSGKAKPAGRSA